MNRSREACEAVRSVDRITEQYGNRGRSFDLFATRSRGNDSHSTPTPGYLNESDFYREM